MVHYLNLQPNWHRKYLNSKIYRFGVIAYHYCLTVLALTTDTLSQYLKESVYKLKKVSSGHIQSHVPT